MTKFHPRFKQAHKSHRTRNEREVKMEAKWPTAPFFLGQTLQVVGRDRNTIIVSFFDGKAETTTLRLEVVADDQVDPPAGFPGDPETAKGDDDNRSRELPGGVE